MNAIYIYSKEKYKGPAEPIEEGQIEIVDIDDYKELTGLPSHLNITKMKAEKEIDSDCFTTSHI
jgi:hypothetical protein